jgi:hypothetical protein
VKITIESPDTAANELQYVSHHADLFKVMRTKTWILLTTIFFTSINCQIDKHENAESNTNENTAVAAGASSVIETNQQPDKTPEVSQENNPAELLAELYKQHQRSLNNSQTNKDTIIQSRSRAPIDKYFDKNLADLIWKDLTAHKGEIGKIDFDLFTNSQDPNIKNLIVGQAKIQGNKATVPISFNNYGKKEIITYQLIEQNGLWKINDIKYENLPSLLQYFKEEQDISDTTTPSQGFFGGKYQVGKTTCTVKPTAAGFEVRWANGSGAMLFYYSGRGVLEYSSEDQGKGVDTFIFDDPSLTTGRFIRADDVEMTVRKN